MPRTETTRGRRRLWFRERANAVLKAAADDHTHSHARTHAHAGGKSPAGLRKNQGGIYLIDCDLLRAALRLAACGRREDEGRRRNTWQVRPAESVSRLEVLAGTRAITPPLCKSQGYYFFNARVRASINLFESTRDKRDRNTSCYIKFAQSFITSLSCRNSFFFYRLGCFGSFCGYFLSRFQLTWEPVLTMHCGRCSLCRKDFCKAPFKLLK